MSEEWNSLVEAEITSISTDPMKKEVVIAVRRNLRAPSEVVIRGRNVDEFSVLEMRLSNIIDQADFYPTREGDDDAAASALFELLQSPGTAFDEQWRPFKERLEAIKRGELMLLVLRPVYGASVALLAADIELVAA